MADNPESIGELPDKSMNLVTAYQLGDLMRYLEIASENQYSIGVTESDDRGKGQVLFALSTLLDYINSYGIDGGLANRVRSEIDYLNSKYEPDDRLSESDGRHLKQRTTAWDERIMSHLRRQKRISVSNPGLFDVERAMEHPEELFDVEVWEWMSKRSREDIRQACRALAIEAPTASIMVSLRAVEDALRSWYEYDSDEEIGRQNLGAVLEELIEEYGSEGPSVLTDLSYLNDRRNEVDHPDRSPDWTEAEATLYRVRETIAAVFREIDPESRDIDSVAGELDEELDCDDD